MTQQIRKITARTVGMKPGGKGVGTSFIVYGRVVGASVENGDHGEYAKLKGTFEAINEETGEVFRSSVVITPGGLLETELVTALFQARENSNSGSGSVDFGARFMLVDADNAIGAEWRAEFLTQPAQDDPVEVVKSQIAHMLPAPEKAKPKTKTDESK